MYRITGVGEVFEQETGGPCTCGVKAAEDGGSRSEDGGGGSRESDSAERRRGVLCARVCVFVRVFVCMCVLQSRTCSLAGRVYRRTTGTSKSLVKNMSLPCP